MEDLSGKYVLVVSDTHIGHRNIIRYCGRPVDADERMFAAFQQAPSADCVLHLGDFGMFRNREQAETAFQRLFDRHHNPILIEGNHDRKHRRVLQLPWSTIIHNIPSKRQQPFYFTYNGLVFVAQHRPFQEFPRKTAPGRWLLQKVTDFLLDLEDRKLKKRLGHFLNYQDIPKGVQVCLHGHIHELGQRYGWVNDTLIVNCCVEHWSYQPTSLAEIEAEYYARKNYYGRSSA